MATTTDLLVGLAEHLDAQGVGTWAPSGVFPAGATAIVLRVVPPTPDRCITLTAYTVTNAPTGDAVQGVQVRTRAAGFPTQVDDLDDEIYRLLHSAEGLVFGGVKVHKVWRQSQSPLGVDGDGRAMNTANYYLIIDRPNGHTR